MRFFWRSLIVLLVLLLIGCAYNFFLRACKHTVARVVTPDGVEMRVVQTRTWDDLLWLKTQFLYRKPGDVWKVCYYHHEDNIWWSCPVSLDTSNKVALFTRNGKNSRGSIKFNWANESYLLLNQPGRGVTPQPQAPDWTP